MELKGTPTMARVFWEGSNKLYSFLIIPIDLALALRLGHVGLVPQSVHMLGGFKAQGITDENAEYILESAISLEKAGCFSVVLECIPATLGQTITNKLKIPTIGIGVGPHVSGQVLVLHDLLGLNDEFKPKFAKQYLNGLDLIKRALNNFDDEVKKGAFLTTTHYKD